MNPEKSVLLIEDSESAGAHACEVLRRAGYFPTWAQSLTEATLITNLTFAVVFLDLLLPETSDDRDFGRAVVSMKTHFPDATLIILSAYLPEAGVMNLLKLGADLAVHKPLMSQNVKEIIHRAKELHSGRFNGLLQRLEAVPLG